jgi:hypothetical protein
LHQFVRVAKTHHKYEAICVPNGIKRNRDKSFSWAEYWISFFRCNLLRVPLGSVIRMPNFRGLILATDVQ